MTQSREAVAAEARDAGSGRFRVLATCGVFEPGFRGGGPVRSVAQIVDTVSDQVEVTLVTSDRDLGAEQPYPDLSGRWVPRDRARVFYLDTRRVRHWLRLWRALRRDRFDLLYVNSLWSPAFTVVPVLSARLGLIRVRRVMIAPRGELSPGALSLKAGKKRLFLRWWGGLLRRLDARWHASTQREAAEIRAVLPWADVDVRLNQVALPGEPLPPTATGGTARLVFIGRIAAKKNLHLALAALRGVSEAVQFDIYGPLEDRAYWSRCQLLIDQLRGPVSARYRGELAPAQVRRTFAGYDAFLFPTLGENFGHVIAESLSASCPVVCSAETPWTQLLQAGGGRVVGELTVDAVGREIRRIAAMSPAERLRARQLAGARYRDWRARLDDDNVLDHVRRTW